MNAISTKLCNEALVNTVLASVRIPPHIEESTRFILLETINAKDGKALQLQSLRGLEYLPVAAALIESGVSAEEIRTEMLPFIRQELDQPYKFYTACKPFFRYLPLLQHIIDPEEIREYIHAYIDDMQDRKTYGPAKVPALFMALHLPELQELCREDTTLWNKCGELINTCNQWQAAYATLPKTLLPVTIKGRDVEQTDDVLCLHQVQTVTGVEDVPTTCSEAETYHAWTSLSTAPEEEQEAIQQAHTFIVIDGHIVASIKHGAHHRAGMQHSVLGMQTVFNPDTQTYPIIEGGFYALPRAWEQRILKYGYAPLHLATEDVLQLMPQRAVNESLRGNQGYRNRIRAVRNSAITQ